MQKIDFTEMVICLHKQIVDAIVKLLEDSKLEFISFLGSDAAEVYFDWDGSVACLKVDGVGFVDGTLSVHIQDAEYSDEEWEPVGLGSDVVYCTIDTVYDCLYRAVSACCDPVYFAYNGAKYALRYVQPKDVGLSNEVTEEVILVSPKSLNDAIQENGDGGNALDSQIYFYTDDEDLALPYPELCKVLVEKGMD